MPHLGDLSPAATVAVGVIVGLLSTSVQSLGLTLQRKSHLLEDAKTGKEVFSPNDADNRTDTQDALNNTDENGGLSRSLSFKPYRPPYRRRRWQIGMTLFVLSNIIGSTVQITTLPLPVLSTLQASGLVFNTICATLILSEPFTRWSLGGTVLVAGGAILIALYGALPEAPHPLSELLLLLSRGKFIAWMFGTGIIILALLSSAAIYSRIVQHRVSLSLSHSTGRRASTTSISSRRRREVSKHRARTALGFAFGATSAILSAHSLLVAKTSIELLVLTIAHGKQQFDRWESWVILVSLLFFALSQLYFLHRGLKLVSTSVLYPFVFCVYNVIAILDGLIYFRQMDSLPALHGGLIALGTVILLAGVVALSWRLNEPGFSSGSDYQAVPQTPAAETQPHTLLAPGMGLVEDVQTDSSTVPSKAPSFEDDTDSAAGTEDDDDEESRLPHEDSPLLNRSNLKRSSKSKKTVIVSSPPSSSRSPPQHKPNFHRTNYGTATPKPHHRTSTLPPLKTSPAPSVSPLGTPSSTNPKVSKIRRARTDTIAHAPRRHGATPTTPINPSSADQPGTRERSSTLSGRFHLPWEYAWDLEPLLPSSRLSSQGKETQQRTYPRIGARRTGARRVVSTYEPEYRDQDTEPSSAVENNDRKRKAGAQRQTRSASTPLPLFGSPPAQYFQGLNRDGPGSGEDQGVFHSQDEGESDDEGEYAGRDEEEGDENARFARRRSAGWISGRDTDGRERRTSVGDKILGFLGLGGSSSSGHGGDGGGEGSSSRSGRDRDIPGH